MKVYITKYALTKGVMIEDGDFSEITGAFIVTKPGLIIDFYHGKDFHTTKESALKRCEEMKIKKLQSLGEQVKKISAIEFSIDEEI